MAVLNYKVLGLRCGLEIHQELQTTRKLFCFCPPMLQIGEPDFRITRNFRPVLGEMGKFDEAMLVEYEKQLIILYEGYNAVCCTYEMDETPPFNISEEALRIGHIIGMLLKLNLYNELYVCRKNYLDGSVTCGFQRTLLIGSDGYLDMEDKKIGITTIAIEEDAARKVAEDGKTITYRLDRLGIPLIEIVTDPDINTPEECMAVAYRLGMLLRSTGFMKRGLGTIRQDVNVSIEGGARVEIKGVQKLEWIPLLIENEVRRQLNLLKIRNELIVRKVSEEDLSNNFIDVTSIFKKTALKFMREAIQSGQKVLAVKLPKMEGILGMNIFPAVGETPGVRFGKEIAQKVNNITGLKGIIHSDEDMEAYSFKKPELTALKKALEIIEPEKREEETVEEATESEGKEELEPKGDAFVLVVADDAKAKKALEITVNRLKMAIRGVPNETRKALENYNTEFIREMHGGARLYPDTDSLPIRLNKEYFKELSREVPEYPWVLAERLREKYELDDNIVENLIMQGYGGIFEEIVVKYKSNPTLVASTLLETLKSLKREGLESDNIQNSHLRDLFDLIQKGAIAKEALEDLLRVIAQTPSLTVNEAKEQLAIQALSLKELDETIQSIVRKNEDLIVEKGERAFSPLMGEIMGIIRGKIDGQIIASKLKEALTNFAPGGSTVQASARLINREIQELLTTDQNILEEKGEGAVDLLLIKLKKRFKGQVEEKALKEKLMDAIKSHLASG
ncbi:MAG: Glu-tRNA(Gln) amidotransferase subunit GatE [Promethearchaeota archaeon]|nr:MAG: Glu-tRNA(Gln) amidotransferase subunit GatE [Candidatus Lokiarchaeota archaeon]